METELKVIVVGNGQVGKTSMITRFATGVFTDGYKKTIGTDFMEKELYVKSLGETVKLMLWDTAGQEMFTKLTKQYYKGAGAVVFAFSTVDRASFTEIESWRAKVNEECGDIVSVLVQNKVDLVDQAVVSPSEAEELARKMQVRLYRTCVKDNLNVDEVFSFLAEEFVKKGGSAEADDTAQTMGNIGRPQPRAQQGFVDGPANNNDASDKGTQGQFKLDGVSKVRTTKKKPVCTIL